MSDALYPTERAARDVSFELDEFTLVGADRLELAGRWFGVRGRRFVRPTLTLLVGDESIRSLADLEHKPWAAEEGAPWTASFPLEGDPAELEAIELAVAPGITLSLPRPAGTGGRSSAQGTPAPDESREAGGRTGESRAAERGRDGDLEAAEKRIGELEAERDDWKRELDRFHDELEQVHTEHEQLNSELDRLRADRRALRDQRDRVRVEFDQLRRERDQLLGERDELPGARDQLLGEPDQLRTGRDHIREELAGTEHQARASGRPDTAAAARAPRYDPPPRRRRRKANWGGRVLAVIVLLGVIAVLVVLVRHVS
jgi:hypothetical protein